MKVIEFFGMPRAGKTTGIETLETSLKHAGKRVRIICEGARICPIDKEDNRFNYHSWSFHNTINNLIEALQMRFDYVLVDRGVLDHIAFIRALEGTSQRAIDAEKYYSSFLGLQDKEVFFNLDPNLAIERERVHKPILGRVFNTSFLNALQQSYSGVIKEFTKRGRDIMLIDESQSYEENVNRVLRVLEGYS